MGKFKELLSYIVIIVVVVLFRTFIATPVIVDGDSMLPNLKDNQVMILYKLPKELKRFEKIADNIDLSTVVASEDYKHIYYFDEEEKELCYLKDGEGIRIADNVDEYWYSDKFGVLYYIEDDELFCATDSIKSKKKVMDLMDYDAYQALMLWLDNAGEFCIYAKEDDTVQFIKMTGKTKYKVLSEYEIDED